LGRTKKNKINNWRFLAVVVNGHFGVICYFFTPNLFNATNVWLKNTNSKNHQNL